MKEYQTALKFDPQHADTMCNLGSALQDLGDFDLSRWEEVTFLREVKENVTQVHTVHTVPSCS